MAWNDRLSTNAIGSRLGLPTSSNARRSAGWRGAGPPGSPEKLMTHPDLKNRVKRAALGGRSLGGPKMGIGPIMRRGVGGGRLTKLGLMPAHKRGQRIPFAGGTPFSRYKSRYTVG
jgi:hypothetical protein